LLASLVIAAALGLGFASRDVPTSSRPVVIAPDLVLDVNHAPPEGLMVLPHVGPALAKRVVEARAQRPFSSFDDLRDRVRGIGPVTLARIAPYLRIKSEPGPSTENLASTSGIPPAAKRRAPRRKATRTPKPASKALEQRVVAQVPEPDSPEDFPIAQGERDSAASRHE
jgi:hypothetical protein